ncbi:uncharacterized protein C8A04DRAFT_13447 [Dichotomopilus funicola]|uniref:Ig-like domain-containing protein n=1 Tax=Dichotomopilus funicola TaxID=1934379 RepID=A0AAN6V270_9PEZI|nr:hypothetical protein C8A04DRAFT_13447 [Dichotomopilus funicola]
MDQAVGRLQAALASVTNEVTVAAANIKFDFSIVKYEAPREFQPVGQLLSDRRKRDAEDGKSHTTARRLAALFAGVCPKTPALVAAYGKRASEIATQATSKVSKAHFASVFSQYTGVDATSMWAAATSSPNGADGDAIQVHLLACMLASVWDAPEATSIWVEIVDGRRHDIALQVEGGGAVPFATAAAAAQAEIPRQQLAEWDASARAWLEVANSAKSKEQTQFRLILHNIELSVGGPEQCLTTTANVVGAWVGAVTVMDNLLSGIPQEVSDGSAIVGLMAWHLYPEIHVFGPRNAELKMNDDLVPPGGILTLGCSPSATTPKSGVTWSLSLSKLRYYGNSVPATATLQGDSSRLTAGEFRFVLVGCLLREWNTPPAKDEMAIRVLGGIARAVIQGLLDRSAVNGFPGPGDDYLWIRTLVAAMLLLNKASEDYTGNEHKFQPFVTLGRNRPQYGPQPPADWEGRIVAQHFFGMLDPGMFLSALRGPEERIAALRRIAHRIPGLQDLPAIIRYKTTDHQTDFVSLFPSPGVEEAELLLAEIREAGPFATEPDIVDCFPSSADWEMYDNGNPDPFFTPDARQANSETYSGGNILDSFVTTSGRRFDRRFGDWESAIFIPTGSPGHFYGENFSLEDLAWALQRGTIRPNIDTIAADPMTPWLARFHYALSCLQSFPEPVISIRTLQRNPQKAKWARAWDQGTLVSNPWVVPVKETFSILAYFISGCDIGHDELHKNIAGISFGSSLYVPDELLRDPFLTRTEGPRRVTRILGNIGKPGLVIFSSVTNPMTAPLDHTAWRIVEDMGAFDGQPADLFASTSMHLSFTQWGRSMDMADSHGTQDVQFTKMESVVSIRDAGRWIGDVDVVATLKSSYILSWSPTHSPCGHPTTSEPPKSVSLKSINNWDELRECQSGLAVVRVHGNWLARLAVTAYLAQRAEKAAGGGARITLLPSSVCWTCLMNDNEFHSVVYIY